MALKLLVEEAGNYLIPVAKKLLRDMKAEMQRLGRTLGSKVINVSTDEQIHIQSQSIGYGQSLDMIRIRAGGEFDFYFTAVTYAAIQRAYLIYGLGKSSIITARSEPGAVPYLTASVYPVLKTTTKKRAAEAVHVYPIVDGALDFTATPLLRYVEVTKSGFRYFENPSLGTTYTGLVAKTSMNDESIAMLVGNEPYSVSSYLFTDGSTYESGGATAFREQVISSAMHYWRLVSSGDDHFMVYVTSPDLQSMRVVSLKRGAIVSYDAPDPNTFITQGFNNVATNDTDICTAHIIYDYNSFPIGEYLVVYIGATLVDTYLLRGDALDGEPLLFQYSGNIIGVVGFDGGFAVATDGMGTFVGTLSGSGWGYAADRVTISVFRRAENSSYTKTETYTHHVHAYPTSPSNRATLGVTKQGKAYVFLRFFQDANYPAGDDSYVMGVYGSDGTVAYPATEQTDFDYGFDYFEDTPAVALDGRVCFKLGVNAQSFAAYKTVRFVFSDGTVVSPAPVTSGVGSDAYFPVQYENLKMHFVGTRTHAYVAAYNPATGYGVYGSDGAASLQQAISIAGFVEQADKIHVVGVTLTADGPKVYSADQSGGSLFTYQYPAGAFLGPITPNRADILRIQQLREWASSA